MFTCCFSGVVGIEPYHKRRAANEGASHGCSRAVSSRRYIHSSIDKVRVMLLPHQASECFLIGVLTSQCIYKINENMPCVKLIVKNTT